MTYRSVSLLSKWPIHIQAVTHSRGCCRAGCCERVDPQTEMTILASKASTCLGLHF